jgi:hypothetical protein
MHALSNDNLITAVRSLVKEERRITREILDHINEVARRRLYADLGFSSIFDWLIKDLGYSESAAYRRQQAARVLLSVPDVALKLESGELGLTVLSKVQTFIQADEKRTGERMSAEEKSEILTKVESCSGREAEHRLAQHFPEVASRFPDGLAANEKVRAVSESQVSVQLTFTREQFEKLKRIQELLSHTHLGSSHAELLDAAMDVFLEKKDPLKKLVKPRAAPCDTAAEVEMRYAKPAKSLTPSTRNAVLKKSGGQCEYRESKMGHRCASRHFLEIDHIQPRALGGTNVPDNLRVLCRTHNLLVAERVFGREKIEAWRLQRPVTMQS